MNEKFFSLPQEKQDAIINAGFKVFSQNSYKKSPVNDIAFAAGISKSLLFYYFTNKKELYLFLFKRSAEITKEYLTKFGCYENTDFFTAMERGLSAKIQIMKDFPDLSDFAIKAFYEKDESVVKDMQSLIADYADYTQNTKNINIDPTLFKEGVNLELMYKEIYWASTGYLWQKQQSGEVDADKMQLEFAELIEFWKRTYLK